MASLSIVILILFSSTLFGLETAKRNGTVAHFITENKFKLEMSITLTIVKIMNFWRNKEIKKQILEVGWDLPTTIAMVNMWRWRQAEICDHVWENLCSARVSSTIVNDLFRLQLSVIYLNGNSDFVSAIFSDFCLPKSLLSSSNRSDDVECWWWWEWVESGRA